MGVCLSMTRLKITVQSLSTYKAQYAGLSSTEKATVGILTHDRFIAFGLLKTSNNSHDKIKSDFLDDFTKGSDNYPTTPHQILLLLEKVLQEAYSNHSIGGDCNGSEREG